VSAVSTTSMGFTIIGCPTTTCRSTAALWVHILHSDHGPSLIRYATCRTHGRQAPPPVVSDGLDTPTPTVEDVT
jgi:hypothetical protein